MSQKVPFYAMTSSERSELLIDTVKNHPVLYDPSHEKFRNIKVKKRIWSEIAVNVGDKNGNITKARWKNLRDSYGKHLRCVSSNVPNSKNSARYKSWPWVQQMTFLEPFITETQNGTDNEKSTENKQQELTDMPQQTNSLKRGSEDSDWPVEKMIGYLNNTCSTDYDATDLIFLGYARTVKKFSPARQALAKFRIAKVVMELELENINEMSQTGVEFVSSGARSQTPHYIEAPEVKLETIDGDLSNYNT